MGEEEGADINAQMMMAKAIQDQQNQREQTETAESVNQETGTINYGAGVASSKSLGSQTDGGNTDEEALFKPNNKKRSDALGFFVVLLKIIVVCLPFLLLSFICYFMVPHRHYSLFVGQNGAPLSPSLEIVRWCLFFCGCYSIYSLSNYVIDATLWIIKSVPRIFRFISFSAGISNKVNYLSGIKKYLSRVLFWSGFYLLCVLLIVDNSPGLDGKFLDSSSGKDSGAINQEVLAKLIISSQLISSKNWAFYLRQTSLVVLLFSVLLAIEKFVIQIIGVGFHKTAFSERFAENNRQLAIINDLLQVCSSHEKPQSGIQVSSLFRRANLDTLESISMFDATNSDKYSQSEALQDASFIYQTFKQTSKRNHITPDDFKDKMNNYSEAFALFDTDGSETITKNEIKRTISGAYEERRNIYTSIKSQGQIISKLDTILSAIVVIASITLGLAFYNMSVTSYLTSVGTFTLGFTFVFGGFASAIFEDLVYLFITHSYDIGDRIVLDGEVCTVTRIEILTTHFLRWDGQSISVPNKNLVNKNIYNIRRSGFQTEVFDIFVNASTPLLKVQELKQKISETLDPKEFSGKIGIQEFEISDNRLKIQFSVEHKGNFQNPTLKNERHAEFKTTIQNALQVLQIEYFKI